MHLYFHHVGQDGSARDFPKTVWGKVRIETVEANIPSSEPKREAILRELRQKHPSGVFNCWGVPAGANVVINNLKPGDAVLLVETLHLGGSVPALCEVSVFYPVQLPELSDALWGEHHFPYIFFFTTQRLHLSWEELRETLEYSHNYDPRGRFNSVHASKPKRFANHAAFVQWLRSERAGRA
jgi:5-methylcytosine-specific restriction protein A